MVTSGQSGGNGHVLQSGNRDDRLAHDKDMLTTPYVFSAQDAAAMAAAGADIIVCHLGLTTGGSIGASTALTLEQCPALVDEWSQAALEVNSDVIILVHGGPVSEPKDAQYILDNTKNCHGFYGASSMERLPTERALTEQTKNSKRLHADPIKRDRRNNYDW